MSLITALDTMRGQPYQVILDTLRQQTVTAIGKIQGSQLKLLQSFIGATGLRNRLSNATPEQAAAAASVAEAIQPAYLAREDSYSINLADPQVSQLLDDAVAAGILNASEKAYLVQLATFQKQLYPNLTLHDIVAHFEPALTDVGQWRQFDPENARMLRFKLIAAVPEPTTITFQMQELDGEWAEWFFVNTLRDVHQLRSYPVPIPHNGLPRRIRWRGNDYAINATVSIA
jgi:hypothetical protein